MEKKHLLFHKIKSIVGYSIAIVVIVIALGVSGLRFLLTTANLYQNEVEQLASSLLEQPVKIGSMDAKLSGLLPTLIFHNVQLISEKTKKTLFSLSRVDVGLSIEDLLWQQKITPAQITIRGMNLHITRTVEGTFKIKGVDLDALSKIGENESGSAFKSWVLQQGEIGIEDSTFTWKDEQNAGLTWFFNDVNLLLKKTHERHQFLLSSKLPHILGDKIKIAFDLVGNITLPETWDIKAYIESKGLKLNPVQTYFKNENFELVDGAADLNLWFDWKNETVKQLSGDVKLHDFSYHINKSKLVTLKLVSGIFDSHQDEHNIWNVSVDKFNYKNNKESLNESKFSLSFNYHNERMKTLFLRANYLKLGTLSKIITDNHLFSKKNEEQLKHLNIQGDVHNFSIAWQDKKIYKFKGDIEGFGVNSWKNIPKLEGLSASVNYKQQEGIISLSSKKSVVGIPQLFRDDFTFDVLSADIAFTNTKQGMLFDVKHLITESVEVSTVSSATLWMPQDGASPYLDFQTYISKGDVSKTSHYLPVSIMDESLVNWLDKGLVDGKVEKSTVVFNGKLNEFPFDDKEGAFSVAVETSNLTINYQDGWPEIKKAKASGYFTGQGMKIHLLTGESENNLLYDSFAEITSFTQSELQLDLVASGSTHNTMRYLVNSPILPKAKSTIDSMRMLGDIEAKITVNIPLDEKTRKKKSLTYSGSARLQNISVFMLEDKVDITEGSGTLFFTEKGLSSKNLIANILGKKSALSVTSASKNKSIKITAKGKMEPAVILKRFGIPGAKRLSGSTSFRASMVFPVKKLKNHHPTLSLNSDLYGIKSTLPEFFYKRKKTRQKFNFVTVFTAKDKVQLGIEFAKKSSAILELDHSGDTVYLSKGAISASSKKAVLPSKNILYIDGSINKITPSKWVKSLELGKAKKSQTFLVKPVIFNLEQVKILTESGKSNNKKEKSVNPKTLPEFEGIINKLYFDKVFLGRLDFKVTHKKYGLHLDEMILSAKNMKLVAQGAWRYKRGKHKTDMDITMSSKDFGAMLADLGFAAIIEKGTASTVSKISWHAAPTQFSLNMLNGDIQFNLINGNIKEVDTGAGRLLGLFSLSALPRKLFGDFKDTFKSGFNFDTANGEIIIEEGDAYTDDFEIKSSIAEISVSGRTGLVARDYENIIEVVPDVGGGIAGITALLVNLPAGIGLWLLDKMTGEQFDEASASKYEISGSWDKPVIERIEEDDF